MQNNINFSCFYNIKNLIWKKDKEIMENEIAPFLRDLDTIPFPDFDAFHYLGIQLQPVK